MASIPVAASDRRIQFVANAGQTVFDFDFPIYGDDHLDVRITVDGATELLTAGTGYTVAGVGNMEGGTITLAAACDGDELITIEGNAPIQRDTDYQTAGSFRANVVNAEQNLLFVLMQEIARDTRRTASLPPEAPDGIDSTLPLPNPGKALLWNDDGTGLRNSDGNFDDVAQSIADALDSGGLGTAAFKNAQESGTDYTAGRALLTDSVATQAETSILSPVPKLIRQDRLVASGWVGPGHRELIRKISVTTTEFITLNNFADDTKYKFYEILLQNIDLGGTSSSANLRCRFSNDNGASFVNTNTYHSGYNGSGWRTTSPELMPAGIKSGSFIDLAPNVNLHLTGTLNLFPYKLGGAAVIQGSLSFFAGSSPGDHFYINTGGINYIISGVNALLLYTSTGVGFSASSETISIYGVRR